MCGNKLAKTPLNQHRSLSKLVKLGRGRGLTTGQLVRLLCRLFWTAGRVKLGRARG
jgi:hypothetical protein